MCPLGQNFCRNRSKRSETNFGYDNIPLSCGYSCQTPDWRANFYCLVATCNPVWCSCFDQFTGWPIGKSFGEWDLGSCESLTKFDNLSAVVFASLSIVQYSNFYFFFCIVLNSLTIEQHRHTTNALVKNTRTHTDVRGVPAPDNSNVSFGTVK